MAAVIARQLLRRGPSVWVLFATGAFVTVAVGVLSPSQASAAVASNLSILVFLFSLFLFAAGLEQAGALDHLGRWILGRAGTVRNLPAVVFVAFGVLSAFVLNDALVLVGVPLLFSLARRLRVAAEPLLLTLAFSVTVGSVLTPFGNPQNLLVSLESGMTAPVATFLRYLLVPTVLNLGLGAWYLRRVYGRRLETQAGTGAANSTPSVPLLPPRSLFALVRRSPVLAVFPVTMVALITVDVTSAVTRGPPVPLYAVALGGAVAMLLASPARATLFARVDWSILVLFAALFVVVAGATAGGVVGSLQHIVPIPGPGQPVRATGAILLTSLGGSQLVSNVPWVGLQIPLLHQLGYGPGAAYAWVALAAGSTLAGNLTLLGAASNLIVVQQAERAGLRIGLREFARVGLPLTLMTVGTLFVLLLVGV